MRKTLLTALFALVLGAMACHAQSFRSDERIGRNGFWDGWFLQAGLDMSLQNPYGYDFGDVFPNGKSFGLDGAIGKWFTPSLGFRGKLNWENGFPLFENHHLSWIGPFGRNGVNMDKGGYLGFYGDVLLSLHGLFAKGYDAERRWNAMVYPRAGIVYNLGLKKGAPLLGAGFLNTYRLNERWSLYADVAYQMCASGFVGSEYVQGTGTGSNSNGYLDVNVGVQLNIGDGSFHKAEASTPEQKVIPSMAQGWFAQVGVDMSLQNPYGCNFSQVFPKGKSFGVDAAVGKWFTHEVALRGHVYWENGLVENKHLEWIAPGGRNGVNHDKGGYMVLSIDALFNLHNILSGPDDSRRWHTSVYPRAGLIRNFAIGSGSPLLGAGIENTYKLTDRLGLYFDAGYQVTTSESSVGMTGMDVGEGSNGFFNFEAGVVISLSR